MDRIRERFQHLERGQIIPIVVVALIVIMGISALILDGGMVMLSRRTAQAAADAGALAGARVFCSQGSPNNAAIESAVHHYTVVENEASGLIWQLTTENVGSTPGLVKGEVVVTVVMEEESFFAQIFNQDTLTTQATAGAGCFSYGYDGPIMPFMYPCNPPLGGSDSADCDYKTLSWQDVANAVSAAGCGVNVPITGNPTNAQAKCVNDALFSTYPSHVYIVMDNRKLCQGNYLDPKYENICKISEDGRYQVNSAQRGWMNLEDGNAGTARMRNWINGSRKVSASTHTWFSNIPGNRANPLFTEMEKRLFDVVWVPVVNHICSYKPTPGSGCWDQALAEFPLPPGGSGTVVDGQPGQYFFHVVGFAPFFPTCIRNNSNNCAGWNYTVSANPDLDGARYSLEGYFIRPDSLPGDSVGVGGVSLGSYIVSLTR